MYAVIISILIATAVYLVNKYFFSYWAKRNVPQLDPTFLVGNIGKLFTFKETMADVFSNIYEKNKHHRFIGGYLSYIPMLIINDPQLVQDVMIRDFKIFHDRPTPGDAAEIFPLVGNLFNLRGQKWKNLRVKLSPAFSSGRLKVMFPFLKDCSQVLVDYVEKNIKSGITVFDFKDLLARLTIDNISSVALGVENDCINDDNNMLYKIGLKIFEPSVRNALVLTMAFFTPDLITRFKINPILPEIGDFIYSLVNQTVEHREKNNIHRNDFMQLLIELKNKGFVSESRRNSKIDEEIDWEDEVSEKGNRLTIDDIAAQVFIFFGAGFETSSSTMSFCLFELSRNKEAQRKAQEEIDRVLKSAGSECITHDLLHEMKYVECCIDETLRKYPIAPVLFRTNTRDCKLPGSDAVIEKGTPVLIPLMGIQRDPQIFEDPMKFKPERFLNSQIGDPKVKTGIVYAPFGDGPRNCIGGRLGKLQSKLGLAMILHRFNLELQDKAMENEEIKFHTYSLVLSPSKKIPLIASLRN